MPTADPATVCATVGPATRKVPAPARRRYAGYLALLADLAAGPAPRVTRGRALRGLPLDESTDALRLLRRGMRAARVRRELDLSPPAVALLALGTPRGSRRGHSTGRAVA